MKSLILVASFLTAAAALAQDTTPAKPWTSSIGAGLALTSGNTDTRNYNLNFNTKYDPKTKLLFKADALYLRGSSNGELQVDKATADAREEYSISPRAFAFAELNYLRDPFKDVTYFIAPLAGAGYRVIRTATTNLSVDGAAGFQTERSNALGRTSGGALKAGEDFDMAISPTSRITQKLSGIWKTDDFGDALYHFDAGLATTVAARLELKLAYAYDYKAKPPLVTIKKGDSAFFAALLVKF